MNLCVSATTIANTYTQNNYVKEILLFYLYRNSLDKAFLVPVLLYPREKPLGQLGTLFARQ